MGLQIIGAGLGRTGTTSLKLALEDLLGGRCYHMFEVRERPASDQELVRADLVDRVGRTAGAATRREARSVAA
jgi:hypothetical protein